MRAFVLSVLVPAVMPAMAQNYLGDERAWIKQHLVVPDSAYTIRADSSALRLDVRIDGPYPIHSEFHFHGWPDFEYECDSVVHRYACGPCFDANLDSLVSDLANDWLLMDDGNYITPKGRCTQKRKGDPEKYYGLPILRIARTPGEAVCATMTFSYLELPKSAAKALLLRLRCEGGGMLP